MDHAEFQRWLDDYIGAWKPCDEPAIGALSRDRHYRYHHVQKRAPAAKRTALGILCDPGDQPSASTRPRAAPVPTSVTGTPSARSTNAT